MTTAAMTERGGGETLAARIVRSLNRWPVHVALVVIALVWLLPTVGLLVNSFRPPAEISRSGWWTSFSLPFDFTLVNYTQVLTRNGLDRAFVNSLFISIPATLIPITIAAFAAYAFSWMEFPGRNLLFIAVVGLLVVPLQSTFIPVLNLFGSAGLAGTFLGIWLAHTGYGLPFSVYLLRNFMGALPKEIFESAQIDGASHVTSFFRLALPMSVPALASLAIFQFLWVWNDLLVALVFLGPSGPNVLPLTVVVANLVNSLGGEWQLLTAAAFISMLLPLIVFFSLQRYFVRGILGGSVKG